MACSDVQPYHKHDVLGYYRLLGLSPNATQAEIRKAYYALALVYHPDKNSSQEAEVMFKAIVQAYDVLRDPESRSKYDSLTYSFDTRAPSDWERDFVPSFFLGTLLGNVFIYGSSVGIIVCPLWGWILAPTLLLVVVSPILRAKKCTKLSGLCWGFALTPITDALTAAELTIKLSCSLISGAVGMITNSLYSYSSAAKPQRQIEDIEDGWVSVGEE